MIEELTKAAQRALEALEHAEKDCADFQRLNTDETSAAIKSLRQALTQPAAQATPEPSHAAKMLKADVAYVEQQMAAATPEPEWETTPKDGEQWETSPKESTPEPVGEPIGHVPGEWYEAKDRDDLEAFFRSRLPAIREAAHEHGYAIGLHGSMRRDLDLIAAPWREGASDKDVLAHAIAMAACGITRDGPYQWEQKPLGRVAASLPCCWPRWFSEAGAGHIDLSVVGLNRPAPGVPEGFALVPVEPTEAMLAAFIDASPIDGGTWAEATEEDRAEVMNAWKAPWSAMLAAAQAKGGQ